MPVWFLAGSWFLGTRLGHIEDGIGVQRDHLVALTSVVGEARGLLDVCLETRGCIRAKACIDASEALPDLVAVEVAAVQKRQASL